MKQGFLAEFKTFVLRGNVIDLAVAVVIGAAFNKIVSSLVDTIMMPAISLMLDTVNLSGLEVHVGPSAIRYGVFLQNSIDFLLIALSIFIAIKVMNGLKRRQEERPEEAPKPPEDIVLLREIRDALEKSEKKSDL